MQEDKKIKNIQSVHRALDILEYLVASGGGKKLSEIAADCGLNKTTAFHLVKTLEARGYVEQSPDSLKYKYGGTLFQMATRVYQNIDLLSICTPCMEQLFDRYHETVGLYHYMKLDDKMQSLCIQYIESTNPVKVSLSVGKWFPLHCTAVVKLYLSALDDENLNFELNRTDLSEHEIKKLSAHLKQIREQRYCVECEEFENGITNIAVPIYKWSGRVLAAICISLPTQRTTTELLAEISKEMVPFSHQLSKFNL